MKETELLFDLLKKGVSPVQAVRACKERLESAGFLELPYDEPWKLQKNGRYYVNHHDTTLFAFTVGEGWQETKTPQIRMAAAHTDFPCLRIKPSADVTACGYAQVNVEVYGGAILNTWLDRPLGIAGRVAVRTQDAFAPKIVEFVSEKNLLTIPNLAIHMNREVNDGYKYNAQVDMLPLYGGADAEGTFMKTVAESAGVCEKAILGHDLFLYNRVKGSIWGASGEFVSCGRLDDLQCAFSSLKGFLKGECGDSVPVHAVFDNEEVGSSTKQGADSTFLEDVLRRINRGAGRTEEDYYRALASSFMISGDNAHAVHPNRADMADPVNRPYINKGIVIKYHGGQKYTTDAVSAAVFKSFCRRAGAPWQIYTNRSDIAGGSTLGNLSSRHVAVNAVDIGLPQLAMHSPYETAGIYDTCYLIAVAKEFFSSAVKAVGGGSYEIGGRG